MQRLRLTATSMLLVIVLFTTTSWTAFAATNSSGPYHSSRIQAITNNCGGTCDNQDPYQTGCSQGAYIANSSAIIDKQGTKLISVYNWYSPSCGTNWNVTELAGSIATKISIFRTNSLPSYCYPVDCTSFYKGKASPMWTNMAYAPTIELMQTLLLRVPMIMCTTALALGPDRYPFNAR